MAQLHVWFNCLGELRTNAVWHREYDQFVSFLLFLSVMIVTHSEWTETFPYDFRDERMMRSLKEMTQTCASISTVSLLGSTIYTHEFNSVCMYMCLYTFGKQS